MDANPGYPCRISLEDAEVGESIIALSYRHHDVNSPYKASGTIFIRENVKQAKLKINEVPELLQGRFLSIRAYDSQAMMIEATTTHGKNLKQAIQSLFINKNIKYIHIHNAIPGCYSCCVERA